MLKKILIAAAAAVTVYGGMALLVKLLRFS